MNTQSRNGMAINAPGAKATPQNNQTAKKLVMKPLKCVFGQCWWRGWKGVCASVAAAEQNAKSHQRINKVEDLRTVLVAFHYLGVHWMLHHSFVKCSHAAVGVLLPCSIQLQMLPIPLSAFACLDTWRQISNSMRVPTTAVTQVATAGGDVWSSAGPCTTGMHRYEHYTTHAIPFSSEAQARQHHVNSQPHHLPFSQSSCS
jgi:hypothetical protein